MYHETNFFMIWQLDAPFHRNISTKSLNLPPLLVVIIAISSTKSVLN